MEAMMKFLIEGQYKLVFLGEIPIGKPEWFDEAKFLQGRKFAQNYYGSLMFSHLLSLTLLVFSPQVLKPLIFTGRSETPKKTYFRYISTTVHVSSWYRGGDIFDPSSKARQSLQRVRNYHSKTAQTVNAVETRPQVDTCNTSWIKRPLHRGNMDCAQLFLQPLCPAFRQDLDPIVDCPFLHLLDENYKTMEASSPNPVPYLNQLDMSGTQFAFMGLPLLYPQKFGMATATNRELEGFVHFWRCIGWMLGIDDRYNFCQLDSLLDARRWASYFVRQLVLPMLKISLTEEYEKMGRTVVKGANYYFPYSYETLFLFVAWVLDMPSAHIEKQVTQLSYRRFKVLTFIFGYLGNLKYGRYFLNALTHLTVKLIVDPPFFWPRRLRPPIIRGLKDLWNER